MNSLGSITHHLLSPGIVSIVLNHFFNLDLSDRWNQSRRANEYCFILGQNAAYQVDLDLPAQYLNYWKKNFVFLFCKHTELKLQCAVY